MRECVVVITARDDDNFSRPRLPHSPRARAVEEVGQ